VKFSGPFITRDMPYDGVDVWEVMLAFNCYCADGKVFTIPCGFVTDGASIPQVLHSILGHPRNNDMGQAACLHDYLYRYGVVSRKKADQYLCEGMEALGASWAKRKAVYAGLRIGGYFAWRRYRAK